jgi:uncharacterized membrane protein YkoI
MDSTKILAAALVVMLAAGGVVASGAGVGTPAATSDPSSVTNANVYATQDNGTVTLTLVDEADGDGIANATVDVEREYDDRSDEAEHESDRVGTTDTNGTVGFALSPGNESRNVTSLEVEFTKAQFDAELEYSVEQGSLSLTEEEYEYEEEHEREDEEHESIAPGNVSLSEKNATNIAAAEANGSVGEVELENEDGTPVFEVELVTSDGSETEVTIHANDGTVLETESEAGENENEQEETEEEENENEQEETEEEENENEQEETEEEETETEEEETESIAPGNVSLSEEDATNVATAEANGSVGEVELENEDGTPVFEVELVTSDGSETEVVIHANDGTVIDTESDEE